jgi:undecaprenyl-diphosphatase
MNWFDLRIMHFLNSFARRSWAVDATLVQVADNRFLVGGVLMVMLWWAWTHHGKGNVEVRKTLALNLVLTAVGVLVARVLALSLPFRHRPFHNPLLNFQPPYTLDVNSAIHWSSFPSDHAVVIFCVAAGLCMVSRRLGAWAMGYAILINLPRIYVGIHYPTDVVAGALLGIGVAFLARAARLRKAVEGALNYLDERPDYAYPLLFAWTFEMGEMFDSARRLGVLGVQIALRNPAVQVAEVAASLILAALLCFLAWARWKNAIPRPKQQRG